MSKEPETRVLRRAPHGDEPAPPATCSICGDEVRPDDADLHASAEDWVIDQIRRIHPKWVEVDGGCPRCVEFYKKL